MIIHSNTNVERICYKFYRNLFCSVVLHPFLLKYSFSKERIVILNQDHNI